ncbi:centrosomal protein 85kDa [Schistosoma haematobium]|uniref:Centrosomal protein 85kDa n=1 Tax=Schistosoma haematobium TaxID=6185 RepID=A0A922IJ81_SCHHA|nr:centrosomal protein 85kDa [Schistosoma haematobium]KAH9580728.1 centrosomal protein 85kDa [Schistosoma haematobium]
MFFNCRKAALTLPVLAFTCASDPCSSVMLPRNVNVSTSSSVSPTTVPDLCCYLDVVVGLAYRDEATELYWLEQPFLKVLPCHTGRLMSSKTKSNKTKIRRRSRTADCTEV